MMVPVLMNVEDSIIMTKEFAKGVLYYVSSAPQQRLVTAVSLACSSVMASASALVRAMST